MSRPKSIQLPAGKHVRRLCTFINMTRLRTEGGRDMRLPQLKNRRQRSLVDQCSFDSGGENPFGGKPPGVGKMYCFG